jgi:hypothetical protein
MSTRQPNPQTPTKNSAMAWPTSLKTCIMSTSDTTRPALKLRRIVNLDRTLDQDRRYHIEAHQAFLKFADLLDDAKWIEVVRPNARNGSEQVRQLRRLLFKAEIAEGEGRLDKLCANDDAMDLTFAAEAFRERLGDAIADYLGYRDQLCEAWTIDDLVANIRRRP